jgi:hypothetical protein
MKNYFKAFLFVGLGILIGHFAPWLLTTIMLVATVVFIKTCLDGMK